MTQSQNYQNDVISSSAFPSPSFTAIKLYQFYLLQVDCRCLLK